MNTRSRSAARAKKGSPEAPEEKRKKESEEILIEAAEEEVDDNGDDDDEKYVPKKATRNKQQQPKSAKKETRPRAKKVEPKEALAKKGELKDDQKKLDDAPPEEDGVYYELNEREMKEVNHAFDMNCPDDGEELLNADGLRTAIRSLGFEPRGDEIQKLVKRFATKKGKINRDGFHKIVAYKYGSSPSMVQNNKNVNDEISRVFNLLDLDKTGFITLDNLRSIAKELNEELNDDELQEMINEADTDGDKQIDKEDFQKIMKKTNLY